MVNQFRVVLIDGEAVTNILNVENNQHVCDGEGVSPYLLIVT